jgi:protein-S-isoprenylcysteine O-methyltransferase Ste14
VAELSVLLAQHAPSHLPRSDKVLRYLIFRDGAAERIRPSGLFLVGSFMTALGGFIRYKCYKALGKMFTFEMSIQKDHKLVTSGPYNSVRHPGYTGVLFAMSGLLLMHGSVVSSYFY